MSLLEIKGVVDEAAPVAVVVDFGKRFVDIEDLCLLGAELLHVAGACRYYKIEPSNYI